ncbi:3-oxoacyl-ACP reductase [Paraburkholderia sp. D15]|uniref:3-oxoacyl-ACP reductase n=1 Tax=Paraburkholderia sp. D15 TaxID=2880218 RepID=UPI002478CE7C|nr:3-oxoacyl-ACP reductase [Paraburkholderia sp. D15]WGS52438.1 3-oxoacyl-ACP reductase [Paraburkholderia sp. D15]WKF62155.1 (S)-1-Phenylethanol dehydrogenase [Paraburkholderia busanensis]
MLLSEQWVLITGGARGLGASITRALVREGAGVVVNYHRSEKAALALRDELGERVVPLQADVTDKAAVTRLFDAAQAQTGQPIVSVVNNALADFRFDGDARPTIDTLDWTRMQQQLDGSLKGALNTIQAAAAGMRARGFGRIVNVGTNLFQNPVVPYHDYTAAKAALLSLTRTASHDLGPDGITVNMVSGGLLRTTDASSATPEFVFDLIANSTPVRRVTTPEEFADAVLFFLSPWARAVTGQNLIVDGGLVKG